MSSDFFNDLFIRSVLFSLNDKITYGEWVEVNDNVEVWSKQGEF